MKEESFSFVSAEHETLKFWQENQIFEKSLEKTASKKPYIFYDGPPFATGLPHHGHLIASTLKDIVPRYFTMKGRYVQRRWGWDCHGLPIEHEIDKKLGMSAQDAVAKLGVAGYNKECRGIVQLFTAEWQKTITRLGRWVDFDNDYKTMDLDFMESVWWVFKQLWDKGLVYKGTKVVPFSTALGTVLSNFEAGSNYQNVQDPSITIMMKIDQTDDDDLKDAYFSAWTTTPWTLPANLGLCVGAEIDYSLVEDKDKNIKFVMAKERVSEYSKKNSLEVIKEFKGQALKGTRYKPLFDFFEHLSAEGAFQVHCDDYVTTDDGTGIVHTAPSFGEDDNRVLKEAGLKLEALPLDKSGRFTDEVPTYAGMYVKDADKQIIKDLKESGNLYSQSTLVHSYPFCPRSDTPLIYKAIPSWYVNVTEIKNKIINANKEISWIPEHIKEGRFGKWLEGARDWAISRNRIWGTPLPIWINDTTNSMICMGSCADIKKYTGIEINDLHREFVDDLTFSIDGEEGTYRRITEVLDCWFESGAMPYAQLHYPFENEKMFKDGFPAEYIAEGLDQTRGWFYTLNILSAALFDKPAFKNVIVNGMVMAEDGKKMSKRLKNYTQPDILMEEFGADALRLYLITSGLVRAEEQRFTDTGVKDMVRRALLPWYNSFKFFQTYAEVDGWNAKEHFKYGDNIVDRWVLSNLQTLKANISREMEEYKLYNVVPALFTFIEDLTNWYIRLNRSRFWGEGLSDDKCAAYSTLYTMIKEISIVMAPFAPFLSDYIYRELAAFGKNEEISVHLCDYPSADKKLMDKTLEDAVGRMQQIILLGRQKRNQVQIKVKTPLRKLTIIHQDNKLLNEIAKLESYIQNELNIKTIDYSTDENDFIKLYAKPNFPVLGKRLGKIFGKFQKPIKSLPGRELAKLEQGKKITIDGEKFNNNEILVFREAKEGTNAISNSLISIDIDCKLDQDLINEGLAREVVNRIQKSRKDLGFNVADRIVVTFNGDIELENAIADHKEYIAKETLANSIEKGEAADLEYKIEEFKVTFNIKKD